MRNHRLDEVLEKLLGDRRFLTRFRKDPEATLRPFGLDAREREAVLAGDIDRLAAFGADVRRLNPRHHWSPRRLIADLAWAAPAIAAVLLAVQLAIAPAAIGRSRARRRAALRQRAAARGRARRQFGLPRLRARIRTRTLVRARSREFAMVRDYAAVRARQRTAPGAALALPVDLLGGALA